MVERFSRWPKAVPIKNITAATVATSFFETWIFRFGRRKFITTEGGTQFKSALFASLSQIIGGRRIHPTLYHPAGNDMLDRWHISLNQAIRCEES